MPARNLYLSALLLSIPAFAQAPAPQRTIMENRVTQGKGADHAPDRTVAPQHTIDSLLNSTEDLNSIRDGYLRRLAGDGCRPDIAVRVAELRSRLNENGASPGGAHMTAAANETNAELADSLLILASSWYQPRNESAPPRANPEHDRAQLLDLVLSPPDSQSAASSSGVDAAQAKAELERLLATCRGAGIRNGGK